jgi:hypothetical protein
MDSTTVKSLNQKLGDALGRVCSGTQPRFAWKWAPDLPYWASRLGKTWVLCQWQAPVLSEQEWQTQFRGRLPYPANGMYQAHPETMLAPGRLPTFELTQNYIWALDRQMSTSFVTQLCDVQNEVADDRDRDYVEWVDQVQDTNPAFSNFDSGKRGGHVSFGGI